MLIKITKKEDGILLRQFLKQELCLSSKMMRHIKFLPNGITVNDSPVTVRYTLKEGDILLLATEDTLTADIAPVDLPIDILYEDEDIVVPSKPANMPTHPSHGHYEDTVANALAFRYAQSDIPFIFRPVNRLDRNTSGLLLIARNRIAAGRLTRSMQSGKIKKSYLAVLDGVLETDGGSIDAALHRTEQSIILREVCPPDTPDADAAYTEYRVLARGEAHTLVEARPLTGRTHQLRVHFASIGHPITGDDLYGTPSPLILRHALHAHTLAFPHPSGEEILRLSAPPPDDFCKLLAKAFPKLQLEKERNRT